jgi:hypothetical protein
MTEYQRVFCSFERAIASTRTILAERETKRENLERQVADIQIEIAGYRKQVESHRAAKSSNAREHHVDEQRKILTEKIHSTLVQTRERHDREICDVQQAIESLTSKIEAMSKVGGSCGSTGPTPARPEQPKRSSASILDQKHEAVKESLRETTEAYSAAKSNQCSDISSYVPKDPLATRDFAAYQKKIKKCMDDMIQEHRMFHLYDLDEPNDPKDQSYIVCSCFPFLKLFFYS